MDDTLCLVHDLPSGRNPAYLPTLSKFLTVIAVDWSSIDRLRTLATAPWLIDLGFIDAARAGELRELLRIDAGAPRLLVASPTDRAEAVRAHALGATAVVARPVDPTLVRCLIDRAARRPATPHDGARAPTARPSAIAAAAVRRPTPAGSAPSATIGAAGRRSLAPPLAAVALASHVLDEIFEALRTAEPIDGTALHCLAARVAPVLREYGLEVWLELVQKHHSGTYQHSLLVMGVAVSLGHGLGLDEDMVSRLAIAGLLHDVGKCWIPESILAKPGRLSEQEFAVVREHGRLGWTALRTSGLALPDDVLDAVLHHHEFLDGSGYPDGLAGDAIAPLTRLLTVCDIFGALAEHRSYRPAFPPHEILQILRTHARVGHVAAAHVDALEAFVTVPTPAPRAKGASARR